MQLYPTLLKAAGRVLLQNITVVNLGATHDPPQGLSYQSKYCLPSFVYLPVDLVFGSTTVLKKISGSRKNYAIKLCTGYSSGHSGSNALN